MAAKLAKVVAHDDEFHNTMVKYKVKKMDWVRVTVRLHVGAKCSVYINKTLCKMQCMYYMHNVVCIISSLFLMTINTYCALKWIRVKLAIRF